MPPIDHGTLDALDRELSRPVPKPRLPRDPLLVERERTHGSFKAGAELWDKFTKAVHTDHTMNAEQRLALCMIFLKLSRLCQNPNEPDHWKDVAGYAKLGEEACNAS